MILEGYATSLFCCLIYKSPLKAVSGILNTRYTWFGIEFSNNLIIRSRVTV